MTGAKQPWPVDLAFDRAARTLSVTFEDGQKRAISFETLRVESPSAETRGHGGEQRPRLTGKENVDVVDARPVGAYAVRIVFDDGHDTGIYSWEYLRSLGAQS